MKAPKKKQINFASFLTPLPLLSALLYGWFALWLNETSTLLFLINEIFSTFK